MKRIFALFLVLCLFLCACGGSSADETTETTLNTTETTQETTTEPTEPPVLYRHPLTGAPLDNPWYGRVTAVVINNLKQAMPQHGISDADVFYEIETEGGITRMLGLFTDLASVDRIGPIRSTRTYMNCTAMAYDAPIIHCGGSVPGIKGCYDDSGNTIKDWNHINQQYNGAYFYRDKERSQNGYAYEHTLFTTGEMLLKGLEDKGYDAASENLLDYGLQFVDEPVIEGEAAKTVTVTFRGGKTTTMDYNADKGVYEASQYNKEYVDGNNDVRMAFRNVVVLYSPQWFIDDGYYYRSHYDLIGSGKGHMAVDGKIVPILWERPSLREPYSYTLEDGTPLEFGVGKSYFAVVSETKTVSYE